MNLVDVLIILFILLIGVYGWHNGLIKTVVSAVGIILVFVLSFLLKNPIAEWLSLNLPFFNFWGVFKGVTILNVVIYQLIAFFLVFAILMTIYSIVVKISGLVERFLRLTIILGLPSKILGLIVGLVEGWFIAATILMFLSVPIFNLAFVHESGVRKYILEKTPIISNMTKDTSKAVEEIIELKDEFSSNSSKDKFNREAFDIMLKYDVIDVDYANKLVSSGKLDIDDAQSIININRRDYDNIFKR